MIPRFQKFSYAFLICGAFEKLTFCTYKHKFLANLRHFEKYCQSIRAECTCSVLLFRTLWPPHAGSTTQMVDMLLILHIWHLFAPTMMDWKWLDCPNLNFILSSHLNLYFTSQPQDLYQSKSERSELNWSFFVHYLISWCNNFVIL